MKESNFGKRVAQLSAIQSSAATQCANASATRVVLATVFAQSSKQAAPLLLPHVENKNSFAHVFCNDVTCANQTYHGVIGRRVLMRKAFWDVERYVARKFSSMRMHANLAAFIEDLVRVLLPVAGRRLFFHCSEIALFIIVLPFKLQKL